MKKDSWWCDSSGAEVPNRKRRRTDVWLDEEKRASPLSILRSVFKAVLWTDVVLFLTVAIALIAYVCATLLAGWAG